MEEIKTRGVSTTPSVSVYDLSEEDKLLKFVDEQVEKMKKYTQLGNGPAPQLFELNQALMDYTSIQASLISLDVMAKIECDKATEAFKEWQADKYIEARTLLNPITVTASKWYSSAEIDAYVRSHYKDEYNELHQNMTYAEMKVAAIRRILDCWDKQSLVLNRLCKNVETEMASMFNGNNIGLNQ